MARVKGGYGAKMARNAGYGRRGRYRNSTKNPEAQFKPGVYGNVNWKDGRPNLLWASDGTATGNIPGRLLSFNADTVAASEDQPQAFLRRMNLELGFLVNVDQVTINGDRAEYAGNERRQIPFGTVIDSGGGLTGPLLGGDHADSLLAGAVSWAEGTPLSLFMLYETYEQAQQPLDVTLSEQSVFSVNAQRNARVFWQKLIIPALYRPVVMNIKKNFPGAGVRLSKGDREIYQISLCFQGPLISGSNPQATVVEYTGENRFWYFLDKP